MYPHQAERLAAALATGGLDALVATTPANIAYITGLGSLVQALYPQLEFFAVSAASGTALVVPTIEAATVVSEAVRADHLQCHGPFVYAAGERSDEISRRIHALATAATPTAAAALAGALTALGVRRGRIGLDEGGLTPSRWRRLAAELGAYELMETGAALTEARAVKGPWEIECLERALGIAEEALNQVVQMLKPGVTEREAARLFEEELGRRGASPYSTTILFGERGAFPAAPPSERGLRMGDLVRFDVGCLFKGYRSDLGRTAIMGEPTARQERAWNAIAAGLEAAVDEIKPGATGALVFQRAIAAAREAGLPGYDRHHVGHGIGLEAFEPPRLAADSQAVLEAGMVLRVETPYYEPGWGGLHAKDTVLVSLKGSQSMNRSARGLVMLD